jgi:hypothetical protein
MIMSMPAHSTTRAIQRLRSSGGAAGGVTATSLRFVDDEMEE